MIEDSKNQKWVGKFIREKRELLGLSQRALGQLFTPPVTTQFISNIERGVTPLPPAHIPTLARALKISESEITALMEREYTQKLSQRLGRPVDSEAGARGADSSPALAIASGDYAFMRSLYEAYQSADDKTKQAFFTVCHSILKVPASSGSSSTPA